MTSDDKRVEPRFELSSASGSKVPASWTGRAAPLECTASDISTHGIFLEMDAPPPVETVIQVGPFDKPVRGRVVFSLAAVDATAIGRRPGVGVQLDDAIDPDTFLLRCAEARAAMVALLASGAALPRAGATRPAAEASRTRVAPPGSTPGMSAPPPTGARRVVAERVSEIVSDVILVDGVPGQGVLAQALTSDGYTPLVAAHGLEALVLCLRRRPLLCVASVDAKQLSGARLLDEVRRHPELVDVTVVLVGEGPQAEGAPGVVRWRAGPVDVDSARRLVDAALGQTRAGKRTRGPDDARVLADAVTELGRRCGAVGDIDGAIAAARYAGELAPSVPGHILFLARILLTSPEQRQRDEAAGLVERAARQDPRSPEAYLLRAVVLDQRGRRDEARAALRRTLMFAPSDPEALTALAALDAGTPLVAIREPARAGASPPVNPASSGRFSIKKLFGR